MFFLADLLVGKTAPRKDCIVSSPRPESRFSCPATFPERKRCVVAKFSGVSPHQLRYRYLTQESVRKAQPGFSCISSLLRCAIQCGGNPRLIQPLPDEHQLLGGFAIIAFKLPNVFTVFRIIRLIIAVSPHHQPANPAATNHPPATIHLQMVVAGQK